MAACTLKHACSALIRDTFATNTQWLASTNAGNVSNEIAVLTLNQQRDRLDCTHAYVHKDGMWGLALSPHDTSRLATLHSAGAHDGLLAGTTRRTLHLWNKGSSELTSLAAQYVETSADHHVCWSPYDEHLLAVADGNTLCMTQARGGELQSVFCSPEYPAELHCHVFHPAAADIVAVASGNSVKAQDVRVPPGESNGAQAECVHAWTVRCMDFAHGQPHHLLTGCDDGMVSWWDFRALQQPLVTSAQGHQHAVQALACHPRFASLAASGGSDAAVHIWSNTVKGDSTSLVDTQQLAYAEESVTGIAWSGHDDWSAACACVDGRVLCLSVPRQVQYKTMF